MELLLLILMGMVATSTFVTVYRTKTHKAVTASHAVKAIEAPTAPPHSLVRTWIVPTQENRINAGWRWKCSCGVWGLASDTSNRYNSKDETTAYSIGTEKSAITGFKDHALQYNEVNTDFYKEKYEQEKADFAKYRELCYCKDANDALILWKDK